MIHAVHFALTVRTLHTPRVSASKKENLIFTKLSHIVKRTIISTLLTAALVGCNSLPATDNYDQQVDALYEQMTLEEKVAQLQSRYMEELFTPEGELDTALCRQLIPYGIGHFSQYASQKPMDANMIRDHAAAVQQWLMANTPNAIPALFHEEVLTGINTKDATVYPQQIGQACSFNTQLACLKTQQTSNAMRQMGGILSLSPMVDVCRNPSFNRLEESYGEDGYLSAAMGVAFVQGLQQGDLRKGVGACSKHYLGYGGGGDADEKEMMEEILLPHEAMIRLAGSKAIMPGYHAVHGTKCVANSEILTDILRTYLGFDGMVVSDYTAIDQLYDQPDATHKAAAALAAGNDVDFPEGNNYRLLPQALEQGLIDEASLERAVKDVLRYKFRCGLFDDTPYLYSSDIICLDTPEERETSYQIATQSVVLLQNNGVLPLSSGNSLISPKRILLTGPNANSMWAMCGDYTYQSMAYFWKKTDIGSENPHIVTLREGMDTQAPDHIQLMYSRGCDWTEEIETDYHEVGDERAWDYEILHRKVDSGEKAYPDVALRLANECDVIVAAMGENVMLCGENRDRKGMRIDLPGRQEEYLRQLIATGKPVVLVLFGGRAYPVAHLADKCAAIIHAWYPGEEGGRAVADILYGHVSPSAKLSISYPKQPLNETLCYNRSVRQDPRVQWPFGHGLSYTTFSYASLSAPTTATTADESVTLTFTLTNTGSVKADEVAQLYLSPSSADLPIRPIQLQGFARVSLEPGESKTVSIKMYLDQFGYYTHESHRQWNISPGEYVLHVGSSSQDIKLSHRITLTGDSVHKPIRDHYLSESTILSSEGE